MQREIYKILKICEISLCPKLAQQLGQNRVCYISNAISSIMKEEHKLPSDLVADIKKRLKTLSGQMNGIIKMLDEGRDPEQINIQFKSLDKGVQKAHFLLLDEVYRKALAIGIVNAANACPGNCGNEDKIAFLRTEFPSIQLTQITEKLKEIQAIEQRLKE